MYQMEYEKILEELKKLVKEVGLFLRKSYFSSPEVYHKGTIDLVTSADLKSEELLKKE